MSAYEDVKEEIRAAAYLYGRQPDEVALIAVTKGLSQETIDQLYKQGQRDFAESRVLQALERKDKNPIDCHWHLIGTLQRNKVRKAIGSFSLIHSVDSLELAEKISLESVEMNNVTPLLLQANCSGESSKHGLDPEAWKKVADRLFFLPNVEIKGLMTMAPFMATEKEARDCFAQLRFLREELQLLTGLSLPELSMGMSRDFRWAIAEGATLLRLGSIFCTT